MRLRTAASAIVLGLAGVLIASAPLFAATTQVASDSNQAAVWLPTPTPTPHLSKVIQPAPASGSVLAPQTGCNQKLSSTCGGPSDPPKDPTATPTSKPKPTATPTEKPQPPTPTPTTKPRPATPTPEPTDRPDPTPGFPGFPGWPGGHGDNSNDNRRPTREPTAQPTDQPAAQPTATSTPQPAETSVPSDPAAPTATPQPAEPVTPSTDPGAEPTAESSEAAVDESTPTPTETATPTATPTSVPLAAAAPPAPPAPTEVTIAPLPSAPGLRVAVVIEPAEALDSLAPIGRAELRRLLADALRSSAPDLTGLQPVGDQLSWATSQVVPAGARLAWPRRLALRDGYYLDLLRTSADDGGLPGGAPRQVNLVLTPAFRLDVLSAQGDVFGGGIYRYGSLVNLGLRDTSPRPATLFGWLGGAYRLLGWDGLDGTGSTAELRLTGPKLVRARWQEDTRIPAALGTAVALLTLLFRPMLIDWSHINLLRKLPWQNG
jgi:hypothetical protein